ncbi:MAG TPA: type IV toxin-antitoxin system AbiEi family antitoxin domain-containing protein [Solirubrobacterales bacterium]
MKNRSLSVTRLAERQWGIVSRPQLLRCGLSEARIGRWTEDGRLFRVHRGVYALGHRPLSPESHLAAALLHAGPGAALSHETGAWWWQVTRRRPPRIHVSTPTRASSVDRVSVHRPRILERTWHRGMPVAPVARTLLDIAQRVPFEELRKALAEAEYLRLVDLDTVQAMLKPGQPGSAALRKALRRHLPRLARTLSVLEERFLELCEARGVPLPEVNAIVGGLMVDCLWPARRLIVELDGYAGHAGRAAVERDRKRDLDLRAAGYLVLRYTWQQVTELPRAVVDDLRRALS